MTVREVSRRANEHLRSAQIAVSRLVASGLVKRVGTGSQQLARWNPDHPLASALAALFAAERERHDRILDRLKQLAREHAHPARSVWMWERPGEGGPTIEIGVLSSSRDIDHVVDALRAGVVTIMREEDLSIEVRGWTQPDMEASIPALPRGTGPPTLLWGTLPPEFDGRRSEVSAPRKSHQMIDAQLRARAERLASVILRRPELVRLAQEEIAGRLVAAPRQEARTLQEWQQVLEGMSLPRLARWLVDDGEQPTRLRQSMPIVFLKAAEEDAEADSGDGR